MGYSPIRTQLMYDRPYATTLVVSVAIAFLGDCWGQRGYGFFFSGILAMVGYILYLTSTNISVLYGSIFLTNHGSVKPASAVGTWNVNPTTNTPLPSSFDWSWQTLGAFSQHGYSMIHRGAGRRQMAFSVGVCVCLLLSTESGWWRRTGRKEGERAVRQPPGSEDAEEPQRRRFGDGHPDFIYTL